VLHGLLTLVLLFALLQTGAPAGPVRIGPTGDRLTEDDLAQIGLLAEEAGGRPWVLDGHSPSFLPDAPWYVAVYLQPDLTSGSLRRGRIQYMTALLTARGDYSAPRKWQLNSSTDSAQVTMPGTDPDSVTGGRDLNRPFRVAGTFSDGEILAIVALVRSSPSIPPPVSRAPGQPTAAIFTHVQGSWPIVTLIAAADRAAARVTLIDMKPSGTSGQSVELEGGGPEWRVVRLTAWIAD
jgi:hypothetical protein